MKSNNTKTNNTKTNNTKTNNTKTNNTKTNNTKTNNTKLKTYLSSKIHKATITEANLAYVGSITIDEALLEKVGLETNEKVLVVDNTNGARLETYVIPGEKNSGIICMNGAAAHLMKKGDEIIIMGFTLSQTPPFVKNILVNDKNQFVKYL
jgi:aspartate 1-decarboxylase